jgi:hypothetical protein
VARGAGSGDVTVESTGDITTGNLAANLGYESEGIYAATKFGSTGNVTVESTGNIITRGDYAEGILAYAGGGGDVTVESTGNITTRGYGSHALRAYSNGGDVTVASIGNITTSDGDADGILAVAYNGGNVDVDSTGNITTARYDAEGINAFSRGGDVDVDSTGNMSTTGDRSEGIYGGNSASSASGYRLSILPLLSLRDFAQILASPGLASNGNRQPGTFVALAASAPGTRPKRRTGQSGSVLPGLIRRRLVPSWKGHRRSSGVSRTSAALGILPMLNHETIPGDSGYWFPCNPRGSR